MVFYLYFIIMTTITINECVYKIHPIYNLFAGSKDGNFIHIIKQVPHRGNENHYGYLNCMVRKHGQSSYKNFKVHRFIWECFNGIIPEGKEIDHINDKRDDNRLCNLQLLTRQENCKKSAKYRDYTFIANNNKNRKCVKATNIETGEVTYYYSLYATQQHLGVNLCTIKRVCESCYGYKSGVSKKDDCSYTFQYIKEEDLPENYFKSANKRLRRVSDEDKKKRLQDWRNKEFTCSNCSKLIKNNNKYHHKKHCKNSQKQ